MRNRQLKTVVLTLICFCSVQLFYAQEDDGIVSLALPVRTSLTFNRYIVNPTFSFVREQNKYISAFNKREWVQFDDAPQTYLLGYSGRFAENIGAGLGLFQQDYGVLTTFGGILNFAYNAQLTRDNNLTFGVNLGVYKSGLNTGKVITNFADPSLNNIPSHLLLTANPGINYGTLFMDFGVSINNLVLYNVQSSELIQGDPRQSIQAHVMYTGYMNGRGFFNDAKFSGLVRSEFGKEMTTISGIAMITSPKGIWAQVGFNSLYGGSAGLGLNLTEQIAIEYNFEKAMGDMTNFGSSHDITLAYKFKSNANYKYHDDDEIGSIFSTDTKRVLASSQPKMDAATRAQLAAEAGAKREEIKERAKEKASKDRETAQVRDEKTRIAQEELAIQSKARIEARAAAAKERLAVQEKARADAKAKLEEKLKLAKEAKAKADQEAKEKFPALERANALARAKAEENNTLTADAKAKADQEAKDKSAADAKAKADALGKAEAIAKLAAEAKAKADQEAKDKLAAQEKAKADALGNAEAIAKLAAEAKAKADQEAKDKLAAQEKAKADALAKAEASAKLAAEAKAKADQEAIDKLAAQEKVKADALAKAEASAKLAAEAKAKADQEAKDNLAAQEKAKADALAKAEASAKLAAEAKAKADQEVKDKLAAQEKAKTDTEVKTLNTPTDAIGISMKSVGDSAEASKITQDELLAKFNAVVAGKEKDLQDLKEENDLSEQGIFSAPKAFKSITEENNKLAVIRGDLDNIIKTNNERIKELDNLYKERIKIPTLVNDEVTLYYQSTLQSLKAAQSKAIETRAQLSTSLKKIDEETEFERKRRIKRAVYTSEGDRYLQDRATLRLIKQRTTLSPVPLKAQDFDFGEKQGGNIQIIKNVDNVEDGYYAVIAVHTDVAKRDEFITKAVAAGQSNIDFFYDVHTSKYFIYYKKDDSVAAAMETLKTKGNHPYNGQMSIIKIEN
ncbi:MAG: PorP/SprF family type IX secretion system membrane protein [Gelidibacter sp.]